MIELKRPGMRTIKTASVVAIGFLVSMLLNLKFPFYVAISSIICIQNTLHGSFKISKDRILGTLVGSSMGIIFVYLFSYNPWSSGIGVLILIYILKVIKLDDAFRVSCMVYLATFIPGHGAAVQYGIDRSIATIIGILIALAVNLIISPPKYSDDIKKLSSNLISDLLDVCGEFFIVGKEIDLSKIGREIIKIEELIKDYKLDEKKSRNKNIDTEELELLILDSKKVYNHLGIIKELNKNGYKFSLNEENADFVSEIYGCDVFDYEYEENYPNEVFNYHIDEIRKHLVCFKEVHHKKPYISHREI